MVRRVPAGCVVSYGQIARLLGKPRASRIVGDAMRRCAERDVPCHRVLFQDGRLCGGFAFGGEDIQRGILKSEGVIFLPDGRVDMERCRWQSTQEEV